MVLSLPILMRVLQARYRQYFENEDSLSPVSNDSMGDTIIPMETQVRNTVKANIFIISAVLPTIEKLANNKKISDTELFYNY